MRIKQIISLEEWADTPEPVKDFIIRWKSYNGYPNESPLPTLGQCIELLGDVTRNLRKDDSDGRFFNNIMVNHESIIGWDGAQLIEILYFEIVQSIKHLIAARKDS